MLAGFLLISTFTSTPSVLLIVCRCEGVGPVVGGALVAPRSFTRLHQNFIRVVT